MEPKNTGVALKADETVVSVDYLESVKKREGFCAVMLERYPELVRYFENDDMNSDKRVDAVVSHIESLVLPKVEETSVESDEETTDTTPKTEEPAGFEALASVTIAGIVGNAGKEAEKPSDKPVVKKPAQKRTTKK